MAGWTSRGCLGVGEDNARFLLLGLVLAVYMLAGAVLFQYLEQEKEIEQSENFWYTYDTFVKMYMPPYPFLQYNCTQGESFSFEFRAGNTHCTVLPTGDQN